ncbi:MAG TPA: DUF4393 domain-containing protein [Stellaceae bacterium]|nr:DUF4393 domain-containing protein [Stellaceae bacterium]
MSDPPEDFAHTLAKEIAKQVPVTAVYQDALAKPTKEAGEILTDIVKTLRLALAPIQALAALQDRYRSFIDRSIGRVPEERRIPPAPQILGPVIEAIRYEPAGTPIDEMFSELLSRAIDRSRVNEAHPAYPFLIRQLSPDEAKILARMSETSYDHVSIADYNPETHLFSRHRVLVDALPLEGLTFPENAPLYMAHLDKLGLAGVYQQGNQEPIFSGEGAERRQTGTRVRSKYLLTEFGRKFVEACIGKPQSSSVEKSSAE